MPRREQLRVEPLAEWQDGIPVRALEPDFAPLEWLRRVAGFVSTHHADPPHVPAEPLEGWEAIAGALDRSVVFANVLANDRPDLLGVRSGFPVRTTLREVRHAAIAIATNAHLGPPCDP